MEDNLDEVAGGKLDRKELLKDFWTEFYALINQTKELKNQDILDKINKDLEFHFFPDGNHKCPNCEGGLLELKTGKFGAFIGCSNYPECKYTKQIASGAEEGEEPSTEDNKDLGENIFLKKGPYGWYVQDGPYLKHNGKFTSLPKDLSIFDVTLEKAQSIIKSSKTFEAKLIGTHPKTKEPIELKKGRFGPYIKYGKLNISLPKSLREKSEVSLEEALELISKKEKA
jgi:DNA topoisomerase-1